MCTHAALTTALTMYSLCPPCGPPGSGTIALTFLSLKQLVGTFAAFSLYAGLGLGVTALYACAVPDMQGRSLEGAGADGTDGTDGTDATHGHGRGLRRGTSADIADRSLLALPGSGLLAEPSDTPVADARGSKPGRAVIGCA